ncbi:hypothetical protein MNBD_ALPHA06-2170, partial [hydrothermal vent metagenome]
HATGDDDLDVVSQSLIKYIQAVGISGLLKPELVRLHLEAVRQLIMSDKQSNRQTIVSQLATTVDGALRVKRQA